MLLKEGTFVSVSITRRPRGAASLAVLTAVMAGTTVLGAGVASAAPEKTFREDGCHMDASYGRKSDPLGSAGQGTYDNMRVEVSPLETGNECTPVRGQKISVSVSGPDPACKTPDAYGRVRFENFETNGWFVPIRLTEGRDGSLPRPYVCD